MMRIIGGSALLVSCALTSSYIISSEKNKIEQIEAFIALIKYTKERIDCYAMPIERILKSAGDILLRIGVEKDITDFSQLVSECEIVCGEDCKKSLSVFAGSLGKGYREHQVKLCDTTLAELEEIRKRLVSAYPSKKKTTAALCFAVGGALLIALL